MTKIVTDKAPTAIGHYSQGMTFDNLIFTAGQLAIDPKTMELVNGGIKKQSLQILKNLKAIVEAGGGTLESVLKVTVFITNLVNFQEFDEIYSQFFGSHRPARTTVEVSRLPKDALIEIEIVAYKQ